MHYQIIYDRVYEEEDPNAITEDTNYVNRDLVGTFILILINNKTPAKFLLC